MIRLLAISRLTLLAMLASSMAACVITPDPPSVTPCLAVSPTGLEFVEHGSGVWMPLSDFAELLIYIEQLKRCARLEV